MKIEGWPEILANELEAAKERPFFWGRHDCCAFAARVVHAISGNDFLAIFPRYGTEAEAKQVMAAYGGVRGIASECLGEPIAAGFAQRGDVVLLPTEKGDALGICIGVNGAFAGAAGLTLRPIRECTMAWRV